MPGESWAYASLLGLVALAGCASHEELAPAARSEAIVGGTDPEPEDAAVVSLHAGNDLCSGALVARNLVLTAAHCVSVSRSGEFRCTPEGDLEGDGSGLGEIGGPLEPEDIAVYAGPPTGEPLAFGSAIVSSETLTSCRDDLAFVVLDRHLDDRTPLALRLGKRVRVGESLTLVGYGTTGVSDVTELHRRESVPVLDVGVPPRAFAVGPGPCPGDSGSPALSDTGAIAGVHSIRSGHCTSALVRNTYTEIAPYADLVLSAFERAGATPRLEEAAKPEDAAHESRTSGCSMLVPVTGPGPGLVAAAMLAAAALRRRRTASRRWMLAAFLVVLCRPLPLSAETPRQAAAEHFDRALAHVDRREFTLAIAEFERAYELGNHYSALYNLGLAYAAVGRYRDARDSLSSYLSQGATELREQRLRDARSLIAQYQGKLATLHVVTVPAAAQISIDGRLHANASKIELDPGRHVVTARADGYSETSAVVDADPAAERTLTLELRA
ncbi:MAG TPA: trypsin-like serine protease, partial [Polyangiaceae bacterium]